MNLKQYIKQLTEFANQYPEALEMVVITSKDDEGNGYETVKYLPCLGVYGDGEFYSGVGIEEWGYEKTDINAVCVN